MLVTEQSGHCATDLQGFRLVDMYTSPSTVQMREKLLVSFSRAGSTLRTQ